MEMKFILQNFGYCQGLTIDVCRIRTYAYFYWHTHVIGHAYIYGYDHFYLIIESFQNFAGSYNFILFKKLTAIYLTFNLFCPWKRHILYFYIRFK